MPTGNRRTQAMTDQGPPNGTPPASGPSVPQMPPPSVPPEPPPPPAVRRRRHPFATFLMMTIGIIALLPGVCDYLHRGDDAARRLLRTWDRAALAGLPGDFGRRSDADSYRAS